MGDEYSSFGRTSMLKAVSLTSGLHGPRVVFLRHLTCDIVCGIHMGDEYSSFGRTSML